MLFVSLVGCKGFPFPLLDSAGFFLPLALLSLSFFEVCLFYTPFSLYFPFSVALGPILSFTIAYAFFDLYLSLTLERGLINSFLSCLCGLLLLVGGGGRWLVDAKSRGHTRTDALLLLEVLLRVQ